jgi:alpha-glucosidase
VAPAHQWWRNAVIYHVYIRSFMDADHDGIGDLPGLTSKLGYLSWLGVHAIWVSPFYRSPMRDFGYDVCDHADVDPVFGTLEDFDDLVTGAHVRDMRLLIDFIPNHTASQHPWFLQSRSSRQDSRRDWYIWRDPRADGSAPNNWLSYWGGPAWEWDAATGQYYLHSFMADMPDLNWRNPDVQEAMFGIADFWLGRGVDGFRVDSAQQIMKDPLFRDNPASPGTGGSAYKSLGSYDSQLHLYDKDHEDVHDVYRRLRAMIGEHGADRLMLGEVHVHDRPGWPHRWASYYGAGLDEFHLPVNLALVGRPWTAPSFQRAVASVEAATPPDAWPNWFLGSHDEPRVVSRLGTAQARTAMMLLLTLRGTPVLYYGDEIGMRNVPVPAHLARDPFGELSPGLGLGRDAARSPMQWQAAPNAGFCASDTCAWLPVSVDSRDVNVTSQRQDLHSMLCLTKRLLEVRSEHPALREGGYERLACGSADCFAYRRVHNGEQCVVVLNFSGEERDLRLAIPDRGFVLVSTLLDRQGSERLALLHLRGHEGCVLAVTEATSRPHGNAPAAAPRTKAGKARHVIPPAIPGPAFKKADANLPDRKPLLRARRAVALVFFVSGMVMASWYARIPTVQGKLDLSPGALGIALLGMPIGAIIAMPLTGWLLERTGSRPIVRAGSIAYCTALLPAAFAPNLELLTIALVAFGTANGVLDMSMNAHAVAVEKGYGRPILPSSHGMFSLGALAGAVIGSASASLRIGLVTHFTGMALAAGIGLSVACTQLLPAEADIGAPRAPVFVRPNRALAGLAIIAFCTAFSEGAMSDWSATYLKLSLRTGPGLAAAGYAGFCVAMAIARFSGDRLSQVAGPVKLVRLGAVLAAVGLGLSVLTSAPWLAILGFAMVGLGLASIFPVTISRAGSTAGMPPGRAVAAVSMVGYMGVMAGPPLIGFAAQAITLRGSLGAAIVFCVVIAALSRVNRPR